MYSEAFCDVGRRLALGREEGAPALEYERREIREPGSRDAGERGDAIAHGVEERGPPLRGGVLQRRQRRLGHEEVARVEAGIDREHVGVAAQQQPRRHQQHRGERQLGDDQRAPQPGAAGGAAAAAAADDRLEIHAGGRKRGTGAKADHHHHRDSGGEQEHAHVERRHGAIAADPTASGGRGSEGPERPAPRRTPRRGRRARRSR